MTVAQVHSQAYIFSCFIRVMILSGTLCPAFTLLCWCKTLEEHAKSPGKGLPVSPIRIIFYYAENTGFHVHNSLVSL